MLGICPPWTRGVCRCDTMSTGADLIAGIVVGCPGTGSGRYPDGRGAAGRRFAGVYRRAAPAAAGTGVRLVRTGNDGSAGRTVGRQDPEGAGRADSPEPGCRPAPS